MGSGVVEPSDKSKQQQQQVATMGPALAGPPSRQKMVQRLLEASGNLPAFLADLIYTQAVVVAGTEAIGLLVEKADEEGKFALKPISHIRPDESTPEVRAAAVTAFQKIVEPCIAQNKDGTIEVGSPDGGEPQFCLVTLLRAENRVVAASAVITRCRDLERARQRLNSMQLVAGYFELYTLRKYSDQARGLAERHQNVLQYSSAVATAEGFESAAMNLCNELANRTGASRVSLGWLKGSRVKVKALSHTEKFDKKQELIVELQQVMEECADQDEPVRFDPEGPNSQNITRCAAALARTQNDGAVLSIPLRRRSELVGVITAEFPPQQKYDQQAEQGLIVAAEILAPQLYDRHENDRMIVVKAGHSIQHAAKLAIGPKHMLAKLIILLVAAAGAFVWFYKPVYHVRAPIQLVAVEKRSMCSPFKAILKNCTIHPGQPVAAGTVLAQLDTEVGLELQLEQAKTRAHQYEVEADSYLSVLRDHPEMQSKRDEALLKKDDAESDVKQLNRKIAQSRIVAPFAGMYVGKDMTDRVEQAVDQGEVLFDFVRSDPSDPSHVQTEVELAVGQNDIQEIKRQYDLRMQNPKRAWFAVLTREPVLQSLLMCAPPDVQPDGTFAISSLPNQDFSLVITRIVPSGEAKESENVFKVYAAIQGAPAWMHPGLAGEARLDVEPRRLGWIWTHRLVDFLRLKLWM